MEIIQAVALLIVFLLITGLMSKRIWPALLAMPVLAVLISLIAGIHLQDIFQFVIGEGSLRLAEPIVISMFGGVLSIMMQKTGIAEGFIKKGAELSGDNPLVIAFVMFLFIILLFTTLGGLGAMIMVGAIVLPILTSVGIGRLTASVIMLMGVNIGGMFNVGNWSLYMTSLSLSQTDVVRFILVMFGIVFTGSLVYIIIQLYRDGFNLSMRNISRNIGFIVLIVALIAGSIGLYNLLSAQEALKNAISIAGRIVFYVFLAAMIVMFLNAFIRAIRHRDSTKNQIHWTAVFTPIIPLILILFFKVNFLSAFILGIAYAYLITYKRDHISVLIKSLIEGSSIVMPAVILMFGIGWLLVSVLGPKTISEEYMIATYGSEVWPVRDLMIPLVKQIIPSTGLMYVIIFTVLAPLALYRGPLNVWGMGFGIASVMMAAGMPSGAILGMLWSVGQLQGISDPTNLQNVWIANEMKVDVQKILYNTLPYAWVFAFLGLIAAAIMYF
ncbi:MAG: citrate transporter [Bacteroidetes bacterium]|nr:citrate transporter [Bacteroidota bacterium]